MMRTCSLFAWGTLVYSGSVLAKLPSMTILAATNWVGNMGKFFGDGAQTLALFLMIMLFLTVAYTLLAKFSEWKNGRAELGDLGALMIVAAVILIIVTILLGQAISFTPGDTRL